MAENAQQILRHVLESPYASDFYRMEGDSSAKREIFEKLHDAYDACMDEELIKKIGSSPLLDVLRKVEELFPASKPSVSTGSLTFPLLNNLDQKGILFEGENQLSRTMAYFISIGMDPLLAVYVGVCTTRNL